MQAPKSHFSDDSDETTTAGDGTNHSSSTLPPTQTLMMTQTSPIRKFHTITAAEASRRHKPSQKRTRAHSSVSMDYFDPEGIRILSRHLRALHRARGQKQDTPNEDSPFDLEVALRDYLRKLGESNVKTRELGVVFENLTVTGLGAVASYQPTVGSRLNPKNLLMSIHKFLHPPIRNIITGFEGVVRPGEMLLVLGRPGAGCSTFLKILANQRSEYRTVSGDVYYDSLTPKQVQKHYRGDVQYSPEEDIHFPMLTVDETIRFAVQTRAPQSRVKGWSREDYTTNMTNVYTTIFGLNHARNTPVGNESIRGVSGGEKKRVSICETLATRSLITSWDNTTRGLDSSTALEFVRALRIATNLAHVSTIVSLYQAGESLYKIFDKVCLVYEGRMVYFGPANRARQYFIDMGYEPSNRQTTADFLVSVTDPNARSIRPPLKAGDHEPERTAKPVPRTALEFVAYYKSSDIRAVNQEDMESYKREKVQNPEVLEAYKESVMEEHARHTIPKSPYTISILMQLRIVMIRRIQILKGDWVSQLLHAAMFIFQAIIMGTTFIKIPDSTSAYFSRGGVIYFSILVPSLFNMSEIPSLFAQRPIVARHQKAAMYHPMIDALSMTLVDIPITFLMIIPFSIIIYFVVKLQQTASQFFIFFLFIFLTAICMKAFFRGLAAAFRSAPPAQAVAGVLLLGLLLYTGYTIPKVSMIGALRWISYINPMRYSFEAVMTNEFHTLHGKCSNLVPSGPGYEDVSLAHQVCAVVGAIPGQDTVDGNRYLALSFAYYRKYLWRNFGILIAFAVFFVTFLVVLTEFNTGIAGTTAVVLFKRGSKAAIVKDAKKQGGSDEEKADNEAARGSFTLTGDHEKNAVAKKADITSYKDVFSWKHITYVVPVPDGHHQLLNDISGYVAPGRLTALMGESGAGKTTLLNVLSQRIDTGVITGDTYFNGHDIPADFQSQTGYCQQTDTHVPTTTVREALQFSARLRQPSSVPIAEKDAYAEKCLEMCGLEQYADAMVGSLGVEYRKRTTIGVELAAKPRLLLFLDEPTSGLDSQSAWAIVSFLRSLADNGQAILCTIHQPSAELFQAFDCLLLLQKGGQTVYFGDLGEHATDMIKYFEAGGARTCEPGENPAEYMLDVIGAGATSTSHINWRDIWLKSEKKTKFDSELEHIHEECQKIPAVGALMKSKFATSWTFQTKELVLRQFRSYWRDPVYIAAKLILNTLAGLFTGFTFFKAKNSLQGTQNKLFSIFMGTFLSAPLGNQMQVPYMRTRGIYEIRERSSQMYHWSALATALILCELPWNILGSSLYFLCWYWTVGYPNSRGGFTYLFYGILFPLYYTTIAEAVGSFTPTPELAGLVLAVSFTFTLVFNGIMQPFRLLGWWKWMYHLSPFTYMIEALLGQAIGKQLINCDVKEYVTLDPPSGQTCASYLARWIATRGGYLSNPDDTASCHYCSSRTTDDWMEVNFNIFYSHHWRDLGFFCAYIVFNICAVYLFSYLRFYLSGRHANLLARSANSIKKRLLASKNR